LATSLLGYDLLLARRSFADAFATARDRLLLAFVSAFLLLWLRDAAMRAGPSLPPRAVLLALLACPAAFGWTRAVLRRLAWFREVSPLAPQALRRRSALAYFACAQLPLAAVVSAAALFLGGRTGQPVEPLALAFLSSGLGVALAAIPVAERSSTPAVPPQARASRGEGIGPAFRILLARQTFGAQRPLRMAVFLVAAATAALCAGVWAAGTQPLPPRFAAALLPSVLLLALTARNVPELVGLLAFAGYPARSVAAMVCAVPIANLAAASTALLLFRPGGWTGMLGALLLLHLFAATVATARAWLSPGRSARQVDLRLQLELLAFLLIAILFAPLAISGLLWRLRLLHRDYSRLLWIQP
jgi:hypothetical protein